MMLYRKKLLIFFCGIIILYILFVSVDRPINNNVTIKETIISNVNKRIIVTNPPTTTVKKKLRVLNETDFSCYTEATDPDGLTELNYSPEKEGPTLGKCIFFHETSCFGDNELLLNPRQACAVESAALMNPNLNIYLLFLSGSKISISAGKLIQQLLLYKNIKIRRINIEKYIKNTALENWYATGILKTSKWPRNHMSDIMRYLTLWKYGGIYMDLDVVVIKSLEDLENFTGAQDANDVAAGVIGFGMNPLGRKMANDSIIDLKNNFLGWAWGHNGPGVITRTLQKLCNATIAKNMTKDKCQGFEVFEPSVFYPIFYPSWRKYFVTNDFNGTMNAIENSKAIHVWNKFSKTEKIQVGSNVPYGKIAEKYCPKTYKNCGETF